MRYFDPIIRSWLMRIHVSVCLFGCKTVSNSNLKDLVDSKFTYWGQKILTNSQSGIGEEEFLHRGECPSVLKSARSGCKNISIMRLDYFRGRLSGSAYENQIAPLDQSIITLVNQRTNQLLSVDAEWLDLSNKLEDNIKKLNEILSGSGAAKLAEWNEEKDLIQKTDIPLIQNELKKADAGIKGAEAFLVTHPSDQVTKDIINKLLSKRTDASKQLQKKKDRVREVESLIAQQDSEHKQLILQIRDLREVKLAKKSKDVEAIAEQDPETKTKIDQIRQRLVEVKQSISPTIEIIVDRIEQENVGFDIDALTENEKKILKDYLKESELDWRRK